MPVPPPVRRAARLVTGEGAALALLGAVYAASGIVGEPEDRVATVLTGVFALAVGLVLVAVGRALGQALGWALSPAVLAQLFLLVVASGLVQGGVYAIAMPLLLVAGTVLASLLAPASRATFRGAA